MEEMNNNDGALLESWLVWMTTKLNKKYLSRDLAHDTGLSEQYISQVITNRRNLGLKSIKQIIGFFKISFDDFFMGPTEYEKKKLSTFDSRKFFTPFISSPAMPQIYPQGARISPPRSKSASEQHEETNGINPPLSDAYILIPYLSPIKQSERDDLFSADEASENIITEGILFKREWIINGLHAVPKNLAIFEPNSDAMEPTIMVNDTILLDKSRRYLEHGGIYIFSDRDEFIVRRVERQIGKTLIKADNPKYSNFYLDETVNLPQSIFGRIIWRCGII
jgi:phage repressor protein C with HTH and peptisase S24 domain